jgi:hypothetical protein
VGDTAAGPAEAQAEGGDDAEAAADDGGEEA